MDSAKYDAYTLSQAQRLVQYEGSQGRDSCFQHDNAWCYRYRLTQDNLCRHEIKTIDWSHYSPDLNLIEQVYDSWRVGIDELRRIIREVWYAVPDEFISGLYAFWRDRCKTIIDARGDPTKY